ncbi:MAG: trmB [Haloplasmataceae bacterium]|jgi:tRNA (guanine-N7-)-methyltransferase|nr:trmB [Haloplasmataceae bacterium]
MRLRKVANAKEKLLQSPDLVFLEPQDHKGKWHQLFKNENSIHIEVGMGKGSFITGMAKQHPDINFIGIEVVESVILRAVEKLKEEPLTNVILMCIDASMLTSVFEDGEIDRVYLNFSDPWPKSRHDKRRLTHHNFLKIFNQILIKNGEIHFKTDNQNLFEYSLISMSQFNMLLKYVSLDLHNSDFEGNVMTEYEERFHGLGQRIYRLEAQFR